MTEAKPKRRSRRRRIRRGLLALVLVSLAGLAGFWAWLESDAGEQRIRRWVENRGEAVLSRQVRVDGFEWDLVPFRAHLEGVSVDGAPGSDEPLFRAASITLRVDAWALLSRELRIQGLEVDAPVVHWDADQGSNLALEADAESNLSVAVESLAIRDGVVEFNHQQSTLDTALTDISLELQPVEDLARGTPIRSGRLRVGSGGLEIGSVGGAISLIAAEVPFTVDESLLRVDAAEFVIGNSRLTASGAITDWQRGEFSIGGALEVADLVGLTSATVPETIGGTVTLAATATFGDAPLSIDGSMSSPSVVFAGLESTGLSASLVATTDRLVVEDLSMELFDGSINADLALDLAASPRSWSLQYEAAGIDMNTLSLSPGLPGFRFAGIAGASGTFEWQAPLADTIDGEGTFDLELPAGTLERAAPLTAADGIPAPDEEAATPPIVAGETITAQRAVPSLPLPVAAHAEFSVADGSITLSTATASLPRTEANVSGVLRRNGDLDAEVRFESGDLRLLDRFFTQIRRFRGEQPVPQPLGLSGGANATARISGSLDDPTLDGNLEARGLAVSGNPVGDVDGTLRLVGVDLEVADLSVRSGEGTGAGEGRFRIGLRDDDTPDYTVGLRLQRFPMQVNLPRLGTPLEASGSASGEVSLTGSYGGSATGLVSLQGDGIRLNDLEGLATDVRIRLTPEEWVAERFELSRGRGVINVTGSWLRGPDTVRAQLDAVDVDAAAVSDLTRGDVPIEGLLQLQAQLTGAFSAPDAAATLRWTQAGAFGVNLGSVALSAELRDGAVALAAVGRSDPNAPAVPPATPSAQRGGGAVPLRNVPAAGWAATLGADLQQPRQASLRAAGDSDLVRAFVAAQGYQIADDLDLAGSLEISGSGVLGDWQGWNGNAVVSDFNFSRPGLGFSIPQPLELDLDNHLLHIELPELVSEAGSLRASGTIDIESGQWLEAAANGRVSLAVLEVLSDELSASGTLDVSLEARGEVLAGDVAGSFDLIDVYLTKERWPYAAEAVNGTIAINGNRLELEGVRGMASGRPFDVTGSLPLAALAGDETSERVELDLIVDALPMVPLWQKTGPVHQLLTGGEMSLSISAYGYGTNWRTYEGDIEVRSLRVELTDLELNMPGPAALTLDSGRVDFDAPLPLRGPGTDVFITGGFLLGPFRFDSRLEGTANLDVLNAVTQGWGVAGRSEIDVRVTGDPPDLSFDGTIRVEDGLLNAPILQPIENIAAELTLGNRLISIDRFEGSLGNTSTADTNVTGNGEIQLVESVPQRFVLNLNVDEALLRIQNGFRLTASGQLQHEGTFERSILSGSMRVSSGEYTVPWQEEEELLALSRTRFVGVDHPMARTVTLDLEVAAPGDLRVVNNVADVELNADLQVRGTLAEPVLLGSMTVLDGTVTFRDQRYQFLRGTAEFQNPLRTEFSFDIAIETSIRQYLVSLNASGSPSRGDINATFASSPPLSDLQLIQLLTVGNASEERVRSDDESLGAVGAQATSFLTRQYLNQVERGAQRVFGIDRFRVEPSVVTGSGDPTARVTIGKQVTPDLWVSWTSVLGTTEEQLLQIEYQLTRGIRLTATREERGALGFDVRFDHRFRR